MAILGCFLAAVFLPSSSSSTSPSTCAIPETRRNPNIENILQAPVVGRDPKRYPSDKSLTNGSDHLLLALANQPALSTG